MPEPVVIIGPAGEPARPSAENVAEADDAPQRRKGMNSSLLPALARLGRGLAGLLSRGLLAIGKGCLSVVASYPRHSLAAGASLVILGAIWYTQRQPGVATRVPPTTQIPPVEANKDAKNPPSPKTDVAATTPAPATTATPGASEAPKPADTATAHADASPPPANAAPTPVPTPALAANDDAPPLPSLAAISPDPKEIEPAPGIPVSPTDSVAAAKSEPAPSPAAAPGPSTPTLLAGPLPEPAPPPSASDVKDDKGRGDTTKPGPAMEAPMPVALTPPPTAQAEPAPVPVPASDPLQLATRLEPAGDQKPSTPPTPPETAKADTKPKEAEAPAETTITPKPPAASPSDPAPPPGPPAVPPETTKTEPIQPEPPKSEAPKVQEPAPGALGHGAKPDVAVVPPGVPDLPAPGGEPVGAAKPSFEGSAPRVEPPTPAAQTVVSQPPVPVPVPVPIPAAATAAALLDSKPQAADSKEIEKRSPEPIRPATSPEPASSSVKEGQAPAKSRATPNQANDGWVSVPNSGKLPIDGEMDADGRGGDASPGAEAGSAAIRDMRAHAAKDVSFEAESPRSKEMPDLKQRTQPALAGAGASVESRSSSAAGRVESVPHVVERGENFWSISRLYYSSGRYYRALWKANAETYPDIKKLKVNDVITVPPVEDLDPAYIDPPRTRVPVDLHAALRQSGSVARGNSGGDAADGAEAPESSSAVTSDEPVSTGRTKRASASGVPVRRSSSTDPDLELPPAAAVARRAPVLDRTGRRADRPLGNDDASDEEPATRTAARTRAAGAASTRRPSYKIRSDDTLRSIARDMLGDSHRASEILDLNRDLIDDPSHLIVGQVIQLPEDARTSLRRSASR